MKVIKESKNKNYIVTIAIGERFYNEWRKYVLPNWLTYCTVNNLGLIVFDQYLINEEHPKWKKATWHKLLIGQALIDNNVKVNNVCFLDADILVNSFAPNVFKHHKEDKISLVSLRKIPYDYDTLYRKIAFFRNRYLSKDYPLDSALFISLKDLYETHDMPVQKDEFCSGFFVFNVNNFAHIMSKWFYKYDKEVVSITGGGDQTHFNYEFQNYGKINWLDYKFQAIWMYEIAEKYPFLYQQMGNQELVNQCIRASLSQNYFLHFAGKWEGDAYKNQNIVDENFILEQKEFNSYLETPVTGRILGSIFPK